MNILEFGRAYAAKYPDRVSELRDLYQKHSKPVMLNLVIEKYPKLFDKLLRIVGTTLKSKIDRVMIYQFLYPNERNTCLTCGNPTNFAPEFKRFREFCCNACRDSNPIIEQRRKENYFENCVLKFAAATRYITKRGGNFWVYIFETSSNRSKSKYVRIKNPTCEKELVEAVKRLKLLTFS